MNLRAKFARFERFGTDWRRLLVRGAVMLFVGVALAIAALFNPDAMLLHAREFSWLPAAGFVVLAVGILECFDAAIAKELRDFFLHLQNGVLDVVVAGLIIFSIGDDPARLSLLIAAFLMVKGILRTILAQATQVPHRTSTIVGAGVSFVLGMLIWAEWPSQAAWFLSVALSAEIGFRGWALMMFAFWAKAQKTRESAG
ncbi:HdeD family acid-resistance protein [Methylomagnum sp.]